MELENKDICRNCGGECCKNSGCEFDASDFSQVTIEEFQKHLDNGLITIACNLVCDNNQIFPILYVKMRNVSQKGIDFFQIIPSPCHALTPTGCSYSFDKRPSGGKYLIPSEYGDCFYLKDVTSSWIPYQNILESLVIKNTGLSVEKNIRKSIEEIFYECFQLGEESEDIFYYYNFFTQTPTSCFTDEMYRAAQRLVEEKKLNRTNPFIA